MGRSRGGLSTKIHAVVDGSGLPVQLGLTSVKLTTTVYALTYLPEFVLKPCCWRIAAMTRTGSGGSWLKGARG
jgi:hypothetical protein